MARSTGERVFPQRASTLRYAFTRQRKRVVDKVKNTRIGKITLHTFARARAATMEYQRRKDISHVMKLLGHRNINNTLIYTHLVNLDP